MYHTPIPLSGVAGHPPRPVPARVPAPVQVPAHLRGTHAAIFFLLNPQADSKARAAPVRRHDVTGIIGATFVKMMDVKLDFTRPASLPGGPPPDFMREMFVNEDVFLFAKSA